MFMMMMMMMMMIDECVLFSIVVLRLGSDLVSMGGKLLCTRICADFRL